MTKKTSLSNNIKKLTAYEHVRLRTEMYFGSRDPNTQPVMVYENDTPVIKELTWTPAVFTAYREVIDNSLDEMVGHGHGNRLDVTYDEANKVFSIKDNGRGVPFDWNEEHQTYTATMAFSELMTGRNFEERGETAGTNGIGGKGVNFCSEYFIVEITRDNKKFKQTFKEGDTLIIDEPKITTTTSNDTGTKITFKLSSKVFKDLSLPEEMIFSRLYDIAMINPSIKVYFQGKQIKAKPIENQKFNGKKPITIDIDEPDFKSKFVLIPDFYDSGEFQFSVVNNIPAFDGGIHMDSFKRAFYSNLITALTRESKKRKLTPNRSDISDGLVIFNITKMKAPNFNSQSKTRLNNEETGKSVRDMLSTDSFFTNLIKKNPEWINAIYERCAARTMKRDMSDAAKEARKMMREKVAGLQDANSKDRTQCILLISEGQSALSSFSEVRNPEIHGGIALTGKVLNVNGESVNNVLGNNVLRNLMNSLGLIPNQVPTPETLRYGKVYIAADSDVDGFNISALLVNFFYSYWPSLFEDSKDPMFNILLTPFIIAEKGKQRKFWYVDDYEQFDPEQYKGWSITRAKGLGSLTSDDWQFSIDNPKLFPIVDDGNMKETLDLIFSPKRPDDRKDWMGK